MAIFPEMVAWNNLETQRPMAKVLQSLLALFSAELKKGGIEVLGVSHPQSTATSESLFLPVTRQNSTKRPCF